MRTNAIEVIRAIHEARMLFKNETALAATRLYIGRIDDRILSHHCAPFMDWKCAHERTERRKFEGLELFTVDDDFHIAVGNPEFPPDRRKGKS